MRFWANRSKPIEVTLIALALWWALVLVLPWDVFSNSPSFRTMADLFPETVWACIAFAIGAVNLYGMLFKRFYARVLGLSMASGFWISVSVSLAYSYYTDTDANLFIDIMKAVFSTTGTGTYFIIATVSAWVSRKVAEQHGRK